MEKFLSAGKVKSCRGKSVVQALKFDSPSVDSSQPAVAPENQDQESKACASLGSKRWSPAPSTGDLLDGIQQKTEEKSSRQPKKRRVRHTKSKKAFETDDCGEAEGVSVESKQEQFPHLAFSEGKEVDDEEKEVHAKKAAGQNTRRSSKRTAVNGRVGLSMTWKSQTKSSMNSGSQPKVSRMKTQSDDETKLHQDTLDFEESPSDRQNGLVNGRSEELPLSVDKSQPTILSMFGRKDRQCRRLGMRGRVVQRDQTAARLSPGTVSPNLPELSSELRRSPRKSSSARPAAMTVSPRKQDGVMTLPTSPARPDEFPAHAVNGDSGTALDPTNSDTRQKLPGRSPMSAQVWDMGCLESPQRCFSAKDCNGSLAATGLMHGDPVDASSREPDSLEEDELPDLVLPPSADSQSFSPNDQKEKAVRSRLLKMSPEKTPPSQSPAKDAKTPSFVKLNGPSSSPLDVDANRIKMGSHPSKLMIKLQKCDHLCNADSPTISASAAMKALKGKPNCKKNVCSCSLCVPGFLFLCCASSFFSAGDELYGN